MARWDDVEVDSDGDELLDWLWDMPDRYDVGLEDDPIVPSEVADGAASAGVRKHIRRPAGPEPVRPLGWTQVDDRPTEAVDSVEPPWDDEYDYEHDGGAAPIMEVEPLLSRFTAREMAAAAAIFLVVLACVGLGYALFSNGSRKGARPSNLAVGTPTTPVTTFAQGGAPLFDPIAAETTTTSVEPTTVPDTSSSVPAVFATTSTTRHCAVRMAAILPMEETDPSDSTTTSTTEPPSTTTTTTLPPTTTTVPDTTTTTLPPTTTTAPHSTAPPTTAHCH